MASADAPRASDEAVAQCDRPAAQATACIVSCTCMACASASHARLACNPQCKPQKHPISLFLKLRLWHGQLLQWAPACNRDRACVRARASGIALALANDTQSRTPITGSAPFTCQCMQLAKAATMLHSSISKAANRQLVTTAAHRQCACRSALGHLAALVTPPPVCHAVQSPSTQCVMQYIQSSKHPVSLPPAALRQQQASRHARRAHTKQQVAARQPPTNSQPPPGPSPRLRNHSPPA